jgi:hypothetical protein
LSQSQPTLQTLCDREINSIAANETTDEMDDDDTVILDQETALAIARKQQNLYRNKQTNPFTTADQTTVLAANSIAPRPLTESSTPDDQGDQIDDLDDDLDQDIDLTGDIGLMEPKAEDLWGDLDRLVDDSDDFDPANPMTAVDRVDRPESSERSEGSNRSEVNDQEPPLDTIDNLFGDAIENGSDSNSNVPRNLNEGERNANDQDALGSSATSSNNLSNAPSNGDANQSERDDQPETIDDLFGDAFAPIADDDSDQIDPAETIDSRNHDNQLEPAIEQEFNSVTNQDFQDLTDTAEFEPDIELAAAESNHGDRSITATNGDRNSINLDLDAASGQEIDPEVTKQENPDDLDPLNKIEPDRDLTAIASSELEATTNADLTASESLENLLAADDLFSNVDLAIDLSTADLTVELTSPEATDQITATSAPDIADRPEGGEQWQGIDAELDDFDLPADIDTSLLDWQGDSVNLAEPDPALPSQNQDFNPDAEITAAGGTENLADRSAFQTEPDNQSTSSNPPSTKRTSFFAAMLVRR